MEDPGAFEEGLREGGLPESLLREVLELRDEVAERVAPLDDELECLMQPHAATEPQERVNEIQQERRTRVDRMLGWMRGRSFRVDYSEDRDIRVPLFVLSAPPRAGCSASIMESQSRFQKLKWSATIAGTGLTGSAAAEVCASATFRAESGQAKLVFLPAKVPAEKVTVMERGRPIGQFQRINAERLTTGNTPGLILLNGMPSGNEVEARYTLSGDSSGSMASYERSYKRSRLHGLQIGIDAYGSDLNLKAAVKMETEAKLTYELKGGFDYTLYRLSDGDGLVWEGP